MTFCLGLDVHARQRVSVCQEAGGRELKQGRVETRVRGFEELRAELGVEEGIKVGLEASRGREEEDVKRRGR
jgi:hypothetical protein